MVPAILGLGHPGDYQTGRPCPQFVKGARELGGQGQPKAKQCPLAPDKRTVIPKQLKCESATDWQHQIGAERSKVRGWSPKVIDNHPRSNPPGGRAPMCCFLKPQFILTHRREADTWECEEG